MGCAAPVETPAGRTARNEVRESPGVDSVGDLGGFPRNGQMEESYRYCTECTKRGADTGGVHMKDS